MIVLVTKITLHKAPHSLPLREEIRAIVLGRGNDLFSDVYPKPGFRGTIGILLIQSNGVVAVAMAKLCCVNCIGEVEKWNSWV